MRTLHYWIKRLLNIGIDDQTNLIEKGRLQVLNGFVLTGLMLVFLNTIMNIFQEDLRGLMMDLIWFFLLSLVLILNSKKKYKISYHAVLLMVTVMTCFVSLVLGRDVTTSPIYLLGLLTSIFFFDGWRTRTFYVVFILFSYGVTQYFMNQIYPLGETPRIDVHVYFLFGLLGTTIITVKMLSQRNKQLRETQRLVQSLAISHKEFERFAYITSHDLKEPLRNISNFSDLLDRKLATSEDNALKEYVNFIKINSVQLDSLVQGIHNFVKVSSSAQVSEIVNMNQAIEQAKQQLKLNEQEENSQFDIENLPSIIGDMNHFVIFWQHLIENALKYNENLIPKISIKVVEEAKQFIFSISDNGIGIDPQYSQQIFDPFRKLHNKSVFEGPGIGLSICRKIMEQHDGKIWVESQVNKGSTFYFSLPKKEENFITF